MPERTVSLIPRVVVKEAKVLKVYGGLLTDERSIFVHIGTERLDDVGKATIIGGLLGGALGAAIGSVYDAAHPSMVGSWQGPGSTGLDPEALAEDRRNVTIPHASVRWMEVRRSFGDYLLTMEYAGAKGKPSTLEVSLVPPADWYEKGKAAGKISIEISRDYAKNVQAAFNAVLPPEVAESAQWDI